MIDYTAAEWKQTTKTATRQLQLIPVQGTANGATATTSSADIFALWTLTSFEILFISSVPRPLQERLTLHRLS